MENKQATLELGTKPVGKLLVQYALPAMIAMTASSLYNIVDRVFIGQGVGAMAISGLAITFPFMNLTTAFGAGVGVGASTAISVKLGQKDYATAQNILGNTISLNLIIGIGLSIICLLFLDPILRFFGASDQTLVYAHEYMVIILLGNVVSHMYFGMNALLRAASKPKQAMYATIFPVVMNVCACIIVIFINNQLVKFGGDLSVGAYGIANGIAMVFIMFVLGVNQGMQPIAGYNYGAQKLDRLMRVLNLSIIAATAIMVTGWLIAMFLPYYCARMFTTDKHLIDLGIKAIRVVMFCFPIIGFQMVITNFFQCIGKVKISIFLSLSRQLLILLPLLAFLPMIWDIDGVWYSMPISDFSAAVIAAIVMSWYMNKLKRQHKENMKVNG